MEFRAVVSSNLAGVHYDPETQILTVQFKGGSKYAYDTVPQDEYDGLMSSPSKGQYFNQSIKDSYPARRV